MIPRDRPLDGRLLPEAPSPFPTPGKPLEPMAGEVCCLERCPACQVLIAIPRSRYNANAWYACEPCGRAELDRRELAARQGDKLLRSLR